MAAAANCAGDMGNRYGSNATVSHPTVRRAFTMNNGLINNATTRWTSDAACLTAYNAFVSAMATLNTADIAAHAHT